MNESGEKGNKSTEQVLADFLALYSPLFMGFVKLLIKLAWNYILLRIDVKSRLNRAI